MNDRHESSRVDMDERLPYLVIEVLFGCYLAIGLLGAAWIHFDFDDYYVQVVAFFCIPAITVLYGMRLMYPKSAHTWRKWLLGLKVVLGLALLPSHVLLVNAATAVSGQVKRDTARNGKVLTIAVERGGLGILFRKRW
jgi:hypothetical protein